MVLKRKEPMKIIVVTQHEIQQATRPNVERNKKKYRRKLKHKTDHKQSKGEN